MIPEPPAIWPQPDGAPVSCREKLKMLAENHAELAQAMQDAFEDAVLMGVDEQAMRRILSDMVAGLESPKRGAVRRAVAIDGSSACSRPRPGPAAPPLARRTRIVRPPRRRRRPGSPRDGGGTGGAGQDRRDQPQLYSAGRSVGPGRVADHHGAVPARSARRISRRTPRRCSPSPIAVPTSRVSTAGCSPTSPGSAMLQSPVYDVRVIRCRP